MTKNSASKIGTCLSFSWGTSRGRDTYGYNICTMKANGQKVSQCNGGGYDMKGTCLGDWAQAVLQAELVKLGKKFGVAVYDYRTTPIKTVPAGPKAREIYGLHLVIEKDGSTRASLDGACGFSSVESSLCRLGLKLRYSPTSRNDGVYIIEKA